MVLIDDAGFGNAGDLRRPDRHAELHADGGGGRALQPLPRHGALLADAGGAADRPQQPRGRLRLGRRVLDRVPRLHGVRPGRLRSVPEDPAGQRLQHRRVRQVAPDAGRPAGPRRAVRPLAGRLGVRLLLRLPRRGLGAVGPVPGREPEDHRHPRRLLRRARTPTTCPTTWPTRRSSGCTRSGRRTPRSRSSPTSRPAAATPRITCPRQWADEVQGQVRPGLGQAARGDVRQAEGARRDPRRRRADAARRRVPRLGRRPGQAQGVLRAPDGGLRRLLGERRPQRRPRDRRDRRARRARQHARALDLGRQRRQHGGHDHRLVQRADDAERHPADRRDAAAALRALRRHRGVGQPDDGAPLLGRLGVGGQHAVQVGKAGRLAPRRHAQPARRPLARADHARAARCGRTSPTSSTSARRSSTSPASRCRRTSTGSSSSRCTA